nr:putative reverse transcriptase domain-containing protein [Tanacetum cinerariifolium]
MDAPPSLNHVCNFPEDEFEEDPQEEPDEEFEEDPEEDPEEELEVEAEDDVPPPATLPVGSPITPPPLFESSSDTEAVAPIVANGALEMPPIGILYELLSNVKYLEWCEKKCKAKMEASSFEIHKVKKCMNEIGQDFGDVMRFSNLVENRVTKLEDKYQEKAEEIEKMKKRLGALETNYALVLSDRDEWKKAIMPPKMMKRKAVKKMVRKRIAKAIEEYKKTKANLGNARGSGSINTGGSVNGQGCTHKTFMNGKPHPFNGTKGVVGLWQLIEKVEQVFEICKCAEEDKVMFAASTFEGRALTWWNRNVHTLGLVNANRIPWIEFKSMMTTKYCLVTEIQRMEEELWTLTLKGDDIEAYNNCFHKLALMCLDLVPNEKKKIKRCIKGVPERIKGNITSSRPTTLHDIINLARELVEQAVQGKAARVNESNKKKWEEHQKNHPNNNNPNNCNRNRNNNQHHQQNRRQETGRPYAMTLAEGRGYNGNLPWCHRCKAHHQHGCDMLWVRREGALQTQVPKEKEPAERGSSVLSDSGAERSFGSTEFTPFINISSAALNTSYKVELADGKFVMRIVRIPFPNGKILEIQGERPKKDPKLLSCIKADEKRFNDFRTVRDFPEVFLDDLASLPPMREIEFRIDLIPGALSVVKSPYRLTPFEMLELSNQLKELQEKEEEHEAHLKTILDILKEEKLYGKFLKCEFWLKEVQFLGHVVNRDGIHVDPSKVESRRWIELLSDYECEIKYHLGKANVVADALSRKERLKPRRVRAMSMTIQSGLKAKILEAQGEAYKDLKAPAEWLRGLETHFKRWDDGEIYFFDRIWIPSVGGIRKLIIDEAHASRYSVNPDADKMYYDLRDLYRWPGMKRDIVEYEKITMNLVTKLPKSNGGYDAIWVIVDRLTKSAHFLSILEDYKTEKLARIYINKIVARHGVPVSIISDRDGRFTSYLWQVLQKALGTKLNMSTTYHPEINGQSERTIQTHEDILRACVMHFGSSWDAHLPLVEFSYNNNYHKSIKCVPFEALYERKCRSPVVWTEVGESQLIGPEIVQETTKKFVQIKKMLKTARSRQKSYADERRKPLEFKVRDQVDLTKEFLSSRFSMKDMGEADVIFGIRIKHESNGIAIYQSHYIEKGLKKFNYFDCTSVSTPMDTSEKLISNNGQVFPLGGGAISWASKKQTCITGSTMESKFVALAAAGKEAEWLKKLLLEIPLWSKPIAPISIRCDSASTLAKAYSQMYNEKSRDLGVKHIMISELITNRAVSIDFVRSQQNLVHHLTKRLAKDLVIKSAEGMELKSN